MAIRGLRPAFQGAIYCVLAMIPFASILVVLSAFLGDPAEKNWFVLEFLAYSMFGMIISVASLLVYGIPVYLILRSFGRAKLLTLTLFGAIGGFSVYLLWIGFRTLLEGDWQMPLVFTLYGIGGSIAFWWGTERHSQTNRIDC